MVKNPPIPTRSEIQQAKREFERDIRFIENKLLHRQVTVPELRALFEIAKKMNWLPSLRWVAETWLQVFRSLPK